MYPKLLIIISFIYRILSLVILASKKAKKNKIYDLEIRLANNKNAIETPFLAVLRPQKGMGGITIGF